MEFSVITLVSGGYGTLEELLEVISWAQLGIHDKPVSVTGRLEIKTLWVFFFQNLIVQSLKLYRWACWMSMATTIPFLLSLRKPWMMASSSHPSATSLCLLQMPESLSRNLRWVASSFLLCHQHLVFRVCWFCSYMEKTIWLVEKESFSVYHLGVWFYMGCLGVNDDLVLLWLGVRAGAWWSHSQGKVGGWVATTAAATTGGVQCHYFADWGRSIKRDKLKEEKKFGEKVLMLCFWYFGRYANHTIMVCYGKVVWLTWGDVTQKKRKM